MNVLVRNIWRDMQRRGHVKMGSAGEQRGPRGPLEARKGREDPQTPPPGPCNGADASILASGLRDEERMNELSGARLWVVCCSGPKEPAHGSPGSPGPKGQDPGRRPQPLLLGTQWRLCCPKDTAGSWPCFWVPRARRLGLCRAVCTPQRREGAALAQPPTSPVALTVAAS